MIRACHRFIVMAALIAGVALQALAIQPDEILDDPALEARARAIGKELRCLVCQNQSIDDSDADLARDLRILVRQRLVAGDSDAEAKRYVVDRYGDFVLLKPPFKAQTLILWVGPLALLLCAVALAAAFYRRNWKTASAAQLSEISEEEEEERRVRELLEKDEREERP